MAHIIVALALSITAAFATTASEYGCDIGDLAVCAMTDTEVEALEFDIENDPAFNITVK